MSLSRHCERSEAIHLAAWTEWIASSLSLLAMTAKSAKDLIRFAMELADGEPDGGGILRLHRDRRWVCRLCGGSAAFGDGAPPGAPARSGRARQLTMDSHSRRLLPALYTQNLQLEVRE